MEPQRVGTESAKHLSLTFSCEGPVQTRHQLGFARRSWTACIQKRCLHSSVNITLGSRASTHIPRTAGGLRDQSEYVSPARCGVGEDSIPRQLHKCHSRLGVRLGDISVRGRDPECVVLVTQAASTNVATLAHMMRPRSCTARS